MLGTLDILRTMAKVPNIFMDGTFSTSPRAFRQIYTIHFDYGEAVLPGVFCLLPDQTKETYEKMIEVLQMKVEGKNR